MPKHMRKQKIIFIVAPQLTMPDAKRLTAWYSTTSDVPRSPKEQGDAPVLRGPSFRPKGDYSPSPWHVREGSGDAFTLPSRRGDEFVPHSPPIGMCVGAAGPVAIGSSGASRGGVCSMTAATTLKVDRLYRVVSDRKGTFIGLLTQSCDTWATLEITKGKADAMLDHNIRKKGEEVTVRRAFCTFAEVI